MKNLTFAGCALMVMGCYSYVPVEVDEVPLQTEIEAVLSTAGEVSLRERVGLSSGRLKGELVERSSDQLMIAVPTTGPFTGATGQVLYQRIDIPRADVLQVQRREPSTPKTVGLLAGAAGAATAFVIVAFTGERNPGDAPGPTDGPDERVARLLPALLRIP